MSAGLSSPDLAAGPAGTSRTIEVISSSDLRTAPMPSSDNDMLILKLSEVLGEKYVVADLDRCEELYTTEKHLALRSGHHFQLIEYRFSRVL